MQLPTIYRMLGILLMLFSVSMLPPIAIATYYDDGAGASFIFSFIVTLLTGLALWFPFRHYHQQFKTRDGFLMVGLYWFVLGVFGALPFFMTKHVTGHVNNFFTDAMFESVSGLTTTGATILSGLDFLPHALLFYRQELQFLGGMGILVLAVAVLPMLDIGGMQLYRAETPGPMKDNKLTPRITETIKTLWFVYLGLTVACGFAYWSAGMGGFDAICQAFSTISTGGFSTHDTSFMYFNNPTIDLIAILFMLLGATNFALHFLAVRHVNLLYYWHDVEFRFFITMTLILVLIAIFTLAFTNIYSGLSDSIIKPLFTVVSFVTTTGFFNTEYQSWPAFLPILILFAALVGACAGSTAGGTKTLRFLLLIKQSGRELKRLIHPRAIYSIKFGKQILSDRNVEAIWGFMMAYISIAVVLTLLLMMTGLDLTTSFSVIVATISNTGAALGSVVNNNYDALTPFAKWICIFAMLAGRLEIFSLLILFTPAFWRE